jgi:polyphosphate kinase
MTPITEPHLQQKIKQILSLQLQDCKLRWKLKSSGEYKQVKQGDKVVNNHDILEDYVTKIYDKAQENASTYISRKILKGQS